MSYIELIKKIIPTLNFKFPYESEDYANNLYLENYHCHKDFSNAIQIDCAEPIENYAKRVHEFGTKCLYSGEHGSQGNQFHVYKVAENEGLKYVHSTEAYWVKDRIAEYPVRDKNTGELLTNKDGSTRMAKDNANCHIILVAKNAEGREDINFALSRANEDGYYYKPRMDFDILFEIPKNNVIVTSACVAGWKYDDADEMWLKIANHFGKNFFFEVQCHNTPEQKALNKKIIELSKKHNIDIICGLDTHYITEKSSIKRDQILKYKGITYEDEVGWYMDYPDTKTIIERFKEQNVLTDEEILRAIMNTNVFVSECEEIIFDRSFKIPSIYENCTYKEKVKIFKDVINKAYSKEKLKSKEKIDGIKYEVKEIVESKVVDYFLTSKEIIDLAVNKYGGILTTTSRGSAASFITSKLCGLTTIDRFNADIPIYPERFLTKERVLSGMMPDIDLNVAVQEPFVLASRELLGEHGCYPLMAVEKLKEKAAWQLYAGANDIEPTVANQISKYLDDYNKALKYADDDEKDSIHVEDYIPEEYVDTFRKSNEYQGITINLKCHACFRKGQLVLTNVGYKEIQDVKIGDYVLTHNNKYEQVLDTIITKSNDLYEIKITGDSIVATGNHPFYVRTKISKNERILSEPKWKNLSEITKDDWIGAPINNKSIIPQFKGTNKTHKQHNYLDLTDENIWWLIGRYIGDGWIENPRDGDYRVVICCNKNNYELEDIKKRIPNYLKYHIDNANTTYKFTFNNKTLFDYLNQFGKYAYGKHLTNDVIDLPVEYLKVFLNGYLSADGHEQHENIYSFTTVSKELAYGLQQCFQKAFLRPCTINTVKEGVDIIEGRICNRRKKYRGKIKLYESSKDVNKVIGNMIWYKVRENIKIESNETVYNLSVNNDNSYTINNLAVHNCGHFIFNGDIRREVGLISAVSESTGKRVICAAIEGGFLDEFGYVKEDFLIVDSVHLTHRFFESIGQSVPTFDELREMIKDDKPTWDIYANGITCCVNQCEKESTTNKVKKYKPQNLAELSSFIAGIRPWLRITLKHIS